jgi:putative aminopeptidase FrvX
MQELAISTARMTDFLVGLLNVPSPTGYYIEAIDYVQKAFEKLAMPGLTLHTTPKGALIATLKGQESARPRGLTAHIDTLGLMVRAIKPNGRLKTAMIGGYMWNAAEFEGVTVRTFDNRRYRGTMLPVNPSTHVNRKIADTERNGETMEIRLDARTKNAVETRALGIEVGDFIFLDPRVEVTETGFIRSRHLDDKAGVATIFGALQALRDSSLIPAHDTHILIANYEEVGHGGAADWPDDLDELLAIDMGAMGDDQTTTEFTVSICAKDSSGPYHFMMMNKLRRLAEGHNIAYKVDLYPYYGSDGSAYWRAGGSARVGLIGPGVDASHAYERTHHESLQHTAHLIARYLLESGE